MGGGDLVKTEMAEPCPRVSDSVGLDGTDFLLTSGQVVLMLLVQDHHWVKVSM